MLIRKVKEMWPGQDILKMSFEECEDNSGLRALGFVRVAERRLSCQQNDAPSDKTCAASARIWHLCFCFVF